VSEQPNFFTDGAAYERLMGRWSALVGEVFLDWLAQPKRLRWLDVGCGNGAFTELIVAHCTPAEVQGLDPSEAPDRLCSHPIGSALYAIPSRRCAGVAIY
jgi:hypothetical protein